MSLTRMDNQKKITSLSSQKYKNYLPYSIFLTRFLILWADDNGTRTLNYKDLREKGKSGL